MEFFFCNKHKIAGKPTIHPNSAVSKSFLGKFKITDYKYRSWILKLLYYFETRLLGQTTKQPLSYFEHQNLENITNFEGSPQLFDSFIK